ncbi:ATP-binding protein [Alcanivorax sp. S6407]|uniref:hybrid sensor histidine kinase/response regulator n=1 Tax=Alcanivorax sp. S6407 TaxID=2926424 RepID=UPI001FF61E34|nr:hybrid sensor histidine kinase/response regulator [Alcanivorax sp. S6407]MCK0152704.1 ATP-binding protein [Alcanivorax sp. S6407]
MTRFWLAVLFIGMALPVHALSIHALRAGHLEVHDPVKTVELGRYMQSWCDGTGRSTLNDARHQKYQPLERSRINFGYRKDACWFRVSLENTGMDELPLWVQVDYAVLDNVDFFLTDGTTTQSWRMGDTRPFTSRPVRLRTFTVPFTLPANEPRTLYLRVYSISSAMTVPLSLSGRDNFIEQQSAHEWLMGGFYGIAIGLFFYHLVLWLGGREKSSRFYTVHVACSTLYIACLQGVAHRLWFADTILPQAANHLFGYLTLLSGLLFARDFLNTAQWRWLDRLLLTAVAIQAMIIAILLIAPTGTVAPLQGVVALLTLALLLFIGLYSLYRGHPEARIFVFAWSMFLLTVALLSLGAYGVITLPGILNIIGVQLGLVLQQVLLSFGLAYRLRSLKKETLQRQKEIIRAQAENDAKSDFLAKMSHEIRTPMNAVLGLAELMRSTRLDATQRNYMDTIYSAGNSLLNVINDILDFSKISSGKLELEVSTFNLHKLLEDCLMIFHANAEQKGIRLVSDWNASLPAWVKGDPTRLRQILLNLLSNAVKFTEQGTVTLRAEAGRTRNPEVILLHCQVTDQGIGMNDREVSMLFTSFQQADSSTSRKYGGTGLGLAISRQLAELMEGRLEAHSEPGKGSTFTLSLPLKRSVMDATQHPPVTGQKLANLQVLVVEDNAVNQMVIGALLKQLSVSATLTSSGAEALEKLQAQSVSPDIILMDCEMPDMDGYQTTALIRQLENRENHPRIPILALTAHASTEHRERCFASGMDDHIAKPVTLDQLRQKLQQWSSV